MANNVKMAVLRTLIENEVVELLVKSRVDNVYLADGTTTLASKLTEIITSIGEKASSTDVTTEITNAVNALRQEMLGDTPVEAYNTFTELAEYISSHAEVSTALTEAIGNKADKSVVEAIQSTVNALGAMSTKDVVGEADLDEALKAKLDAVVEGKHSHTNKELLDSYTQTEADLADAVAKKHSHANATVLDGITAEKVTAWDNKANAYIQDSQPANLKAGDIWVQLI